MSENSDRDQTPVEEVLSKEAEKPSEEKPVESVTAPPAEVPEEEIVEERIYTVPLRRLFWTGSRLRRSSRAIRAIREFVTRHMKPEQLLIEKEVNERIWSRGIQKPPRKIRVRVTKNSENLVRVYLAEG
ncbi:MAG: 50S ribosomal protein L31e [Candidatus Thorarchaeota archaeon]